MNRSKLRNIGITNISRVLLRRIGLLIKVYFRNKQYVTALLLLLLGPVVTLFYYFFFFFDKLIYEGLDRVKVKKPIFIVGHPRSGTTYLQKRLVETGQLAYSTTHTLAAPSLIIRKIIGPFFHLFNKLELNLLETEKKGHKIELTGIEEDEAIFLHTFNTELLTILCPWMITDKEFKEKGLKIGWDDHRESELNVQFLKEYIKRQTVKQKKDRMLIKSNPSIFRIKQILKTFPDANIIYIVRAPDDAIVSFFSFHDKYLNGRLTEKERKKYFSEKYKWSRHLYEYFEEVKHEIPDNQLKIVPFPRIKNDLTALLKEVCKFLDLKPEKEYWETIKKYGQRDKKKKHKNRDYSSFGLTQKKIKKDLNFIWKKYSV